MQGIMSKFSNRLKELIDEKELSLTALARETGIQQSNLSDFLAEKHTPSFANFVALLSFFNCSAEYLLGRTELPTTEKLYPVLPFHERLRAVMKECGISQTKMIKEMPVSSGALYKWVSGKAQPSTDTLIRLADFLDCSVDYLIGRIR